MIMIALMQGSCRPKHLTQPIAERQIEIISGGSNAAYGHHVLHINKSGVQIDTSYYTSEHELYRGQDTTHFYKHLNVFNTDMRVPLNRPIYQQLLELPLDTLMSYEKLTQNDEHLPYHLHPVTIHEDGKKYVLNFRIHTDRSWLPSHIQSFVTRLEEMFPFRLGVLDCSSQYYK